MNGTYDVAICGAGIAGVAAAYYLSVEHRVSRVCIIDAGDPLSLTSDKSTECYRNWWPGPGTAMVEMSNRSIDLLESIADATDNRIAMSRRGYAFATADPRTVNTLRAQAVDAAARGAGPFREHGSAMHSDYFAHPSEGWRNLPEGIDLLTDPALIQQHFPALTDSACGLLHVRRCGWVSAQQLGAWMLEEARAHGVTFISGAMSAVNRAGGRVNAVTVQRGDGTTTELGVGALVLAPGPHLASVARLLDLELPVTCECHVKVGLRDTLNAFPADAPLLSWCDPVRLPWSGEERDALAADAESRYLLETFPPGVHGRPMGRSGHHYAWMLWTYDLADSEPTFPIEWDPHMPEIIIRGLSAMLPGMRGYFDPLPRTLVDGGYYCKTPENRPLVGPLPVDGAFVNAAYSGYGIMTSCAGGELLANHLTGSALPDYADALLPSRYDDPTYLDQFGDARNAGQI
ncbi:MAG: FAD-dependent oxidoreductase [Pseudomonadota bacterium]